tara:strand:+ start:1932 stop:2171 length:240 start_codon:yes stop_codon:yes gene_type:complete
MSLSEEQKIIISQQSGNYNMEHKDMINWIKITFKNYVSEKLNKEVTWSEVLIWCRENNLKSYLSNVPDAYDFFINYLEK